MKYFLAKFKGALITALVFVLLLAFIYSRERGNKPAVISEESYSFVTDINADEVVSVEIYYPLSWVLLENEGENWVLIEDESRRDADDKIIKELIESIKNTQIAGTVPADEVNLEQFGLESAKAEVIVNTEKKDYRLIVGDNIPVGSGTYVYDPDEKIVFVVEKDYLNRFLDLSPDDFRERGLLEFDSEKIKRIAISSGSFSADIYKEAGEWVVEGQGQAVADEKKIGEILWIFSHAKVLDFEAERQENPKSYGFDEPTAEIRFYEDERIYGLVFGERKDEDSYYVKTDSDASVYTIHKSLFKRVPKNNDEITLK